MIQLIHFQPNGVTDDSPHHVRIQYLRCLESFKFLLYINDTISCDNIPNAKRFS